MSEMAQILIQFRKRFDEAVLLAVRLSEVEDDVEPFLNRELELAFARLSELGLIERDDED